MRPPPTHSTPPRLGDVRGRASRGSASGASGRSRNRRSGKLDAVRAVASAALARGIPPPPTRNARTPPAIPFVDGSGRRPRCGRSLTGGSSPSDNVRARFRVARVRLGPWRPGEWPGGRRARVVLLRVDRAPRSASRSFPGGDGRRRRTRRRRRLRARPDRQVAGFRLRRAARCGARPGRPSRRRDEDRRGGRQPHGADRRHRGGAGTRRDRAPAPSRRSRSLAWPRSFIERTLLAQPVVWIGAGSSNHMASPVPDRASAPLARPADGRRRRGHLTSVREEEVAACARPRRSG
jgi:hypothetical protein